MSDQTTILTERNIFDGYIKIREGVFTHTINGATSPQIKRLSVERGASVGMLIYEKSTNCFVFTSQYRYPTRGELIEIAAGMVDGDETAYDAAVRELTEEIGNGKILTTYVAGSFFLSPGILSEKMSIFAMIVDAIDNETGGGLASEGEYISTVRIPREVAFEMNDRNLFEDVKTALALRHFQSLNLNL